MKRGTRAAATPSFSLLFGNDFISEIPNDSDAVDGSKVMVPGRDTVASRDNNAQDVLRAGYRDSDILVADDRDDLVGAAAR